MRFVFLGLVALAAGVSCSPRSTTPATPTLPAPAASAHAVPASAQPKTAAKTSGPPTSAVCASFAQAYCERASACTPGLFKSDHGDLAICSERWASWCTRTQTLTNSAFTDSSVHACEAAIEKTPCGRWREFDDLAIPACHPEGTVARGGSCLESTQCETGLCLKDPTQHGSACGTCEPRAKPNGQCFMGYTGPRLGCPLGSACSRGLCIGPLKDVGEPCGAGSAWSSDCYGDSMFGRGDVQCSGKPPSPEWMGRCEREPGFSPCASAAACPAAASEGETCGDAAERGETVRCSFPLLCVAGTCARIDPACR
jgi:hypothetical protein